jgi:hypothetical protein
MKEKISSLRRSVKQVMKIITWRMGGQEASTDARPRILPVASIITPVIGAAEVK